MFTITNKVKAYWHGGVAVLKQYKPLAAVYFAAFFALLSRGAAFAGGGGESDPIAGDWGAIATVLTGAMGNLATGAVTMITALGPVMLLIAGFALGVIILGAIASAIRSIRI